MFDPEVTFSVSVMGLEAVTPMAPCAFRPTMLLAPPMVNPPVFLIQIPLAPAIASSLLTWVSISFEDMPIPAAALKTA